MLVAALVAALVATFGPPLGISQPLSARPSVTQLDAIAKENGDRFLAALKARGLTELDLIRKAGIQPLAVECGSRWRVDSAKVNDGSTGDDDWVFTYLVTYRACWGDSDEDGKPWFWARPTGDASSYEFEDEMKCSGNDDSGYNLNGLKHVTVRAYMSDIAGRNFNPDMTKIPCDEDGSNSRRRTFHLQFTELYRVGPVYPKARTLMKTQKTANVYEAEAELRLKLRECSGFATAPCDD